MKANKWSIRLQINANKGEPKGIDQGWQYPGWARETGSIECSSRIVVSSSAFIIVCTNEQGIWNGIHERPSLH